MIETVFVNATAGDNPITDTTYIRQPVETFISLGVFTQAIYKWNLKTAAQKTVANLVTHFTQADVKRCLLDPTTKATFNANTAQKPAVVTKAVPTKFTW